MPYSPQDLRSKVSTNQEMSFLSLCERIDETMEKTKDLIPIPSEELEELASPILHQFVNKRRSFTNEDIFKELKNIYPNKNILLGCVRTYLRDNFYYGSFGYNRTTEYIDSYFPND